MAYGRDRTSASDQEANEIRGAYTHAAEFAQERVRMMRWRADELDRLKDIGRDVQMSA